MDDSTDGGLAGMTDEGFRQERLDNEVRARIATLSEQVAQLRDALAASAANEEIELESLRSEIDSTRAELQHVRNENDALRHSMSWRITRPLRRLRGGF